MGRLLREVTGCSRWTWTVGRKGGGRGGTWEALEDIKRLPVSHSPTVSWLLGSRKGILLCHRVLAMQARPEDKGRLIGGGNVIVPSRGYNHVFTSISSILSFPLYVKLILK